MEEWSDYMKENELLEYLNNTRDKLSEELYNFYEKQKQGLFDYINNQDQHLSKDIYKFIEEQKQELFDYINTQDNNLSDSIYNFIQKQNIQNLNDIYNQLEHGQKTMRDYIDYKISDAYAKIGSEMKKEHDFKYIKIFFDRYSDYTSWIILLGVPEHGNIGDHAITIGEENFFKKNFPNLPYVTFPWKFVNFYWNFLKLKIKPTDLICIHGGGFLGTLWENEQENLTKALELFNHNPIIIMPQSFWYDGDADHKLLMESFENAMKRCDNLCVCIREERSLERFQHKFPEITTMLIPDMAFYIQNKVNAKRFDNVLLCLRGDKEKISPETQDIASTIKCLGYSVKETSTVVDENIPIGMSELYVYNKLTEFASARLVITDRLHGLIFSAITNTPCIAFDNLSGKVHGTYRWIESIPTIKLVNEINNIKDCINVLYTENGFDINMDDKYKKLIGYMKKECFSRNIC